MAECAGKMDMSAMMMVVGAMADTVFLYARAIVDKVQQPFLRKEGEGTKIEIILPQDEKIM